MVTHTETPPVEAPPLPPPEHDEQGIDLETAAGMLGLQPERARRLARQGTLPGLAGKVGGQWVIHRGRLREFLRQTPEPAA